jgi:hypothetical protein
MTKKAQAAITWLVMAFVITLMCPFPTRIAQPLTVQFARGDGQPLPEIHVYQKWECYGLLGSGHHEATIDASGRASFPARRAWGSIATRFLFRAFTVIAVHSSYGASVTLEFTLLPPFEVGFHSPTFSPLELLATSGSYRDEDARVHFYQRSQDGQRVIVSGEFAIGSNTLRFPIEKKKPNQASEPTAPSGRGSP